MILKKGLFTYKEEVKGIAINFKFMFNPGSDEVVLFLHGLGCSSDSFRYLFDKDYFPDKSLLLIDLPGYGASAKPESFSYSMEDMALIIAELSAGLPPQKIHIAAHSMGGAVALLFPEKFYEQVDSFTNIEGNLISEDCGLLSRGIASVPYEEYIAENYIQQRKDFAGHDQLRFEQTTPDVLYKSAGSLVKWSDSGELLEKFNRLKCKKCYFYGEENIGMPILKKLGGIKKFMISSSGHGMMTDNPAEFYTRLAEFIYS